MYTASVTHSQIQVLPPQSLTLSSGFTVTIALKWDNETKNSLRPSSVAPPCLVCIMGIKSPSKLGLKPSFYNFKVSIFHNVCQDAQMDHCKLWNGPLWNVSVYSDSVYFNTYPHFWVLRSVWSRNPEVNVVVHLSINFQESVMHYTRVGLDLYCEEYQNISRSLSQLFFSFPNFTILLNTL